jgi:hypothetical protein
LVVSGFVIALGACSSSAQSDAPVVGVNDVAKACALRTHWTNATAQTCTDCKSFASTQKCACSDLDYAGKCSDQAAAVTNEPSCAGTDECVRACAATDCTCIERCYEGKACRSVAGARDGCLAEICDTRCR